MALSALDPAGTDMYRPTGWSLFAIVVFLISYGSVYPFEWTQPASTAAAWLGLVTEPRFPKSLGDLVGNLFLFVPLGVVGMTALPLRAPALRAGVTLGVALILAIGLQAAQIYLPSRSPALGDAAWNLIGTSIGVGLGWLCAGRLVGLSLASLSLPAGLFILWLATELIPFVPALDWQSMKDSLKPLAEGDFDLAAAMLHAAGVLLAGEALSRIVAPRFARVALPLVIAFVLLAKILVATQHLDGSVVAGFAIGLVAALVLRALPTARRAGVVAAALLLAFTMAALAPFEFAASPNRFLWIPFEGLLSGSMLANTRSLLASSLAFAGVAWIARDAGGSARAAGIGMAGLAILLEFTQIYIRGRTPDITSPIIAVVAGWVIAKWPAGGSARPPIAVASDAPTAVNSGDTIHSGISWRAWLLRLSFVSVLIAAAIAAVLRVPGIPYNVAELFRADAAFPILILFAFAILWNGAAPALVSGWIHATPRNDWLLPPAVFVTSLVALALLWISVTEESIGDIAGSTNLNWFVINKEIWGGWARRLFLAIDAPDLIGFVERCVRFAALHGPIVTFPAVLFLLLDARRVGMISPRRVVNWWVLAVLWLWLCKAIAFDWSSTDNLNELIAREGFFGLGGGGYLYLLLALMSANVVLLASTPIRPWPAIAALMLSIGSVPCGWWLLTRGLEPQVEKYGQVFSGAQFLLGENRAKLLGDGELFARWSVVQLGAVLLAAIGARLARTLPAASLRRRPRQKASA